MPPSQTPEKGDKVSWDWAGSAPGGEVSAKKTEGEATVTSKRGNTIRKSADPEDPALEITRSGNDVVKKQSEVEVEEKASKNKNKTPKAKSTPNKKGATSKKSAPAEEADEEEDAEDAGEEPKANGNTKASKKRGRDADDEETEAPAKKTRGRKPGTATSKPKATPYVPTGRPRGRPATGNAKPKAEKPKVLGPDGKPRGRGRPPKATKAKTTASPKKSPAAAKGKPGRKSTRK